MSTGGRIFAYYTRAVTVGCGNGGRGGGGVQFLTCCVIEVKLACIGEGKR